MGTSADVAPPSLRSRRSWLLAALLLLAAAALSAYSVYLHWLPCRGSMLHGTAFQDPSSGTNFSDACLRRMDAAIPFPYPAEPAEQAPGASEIAAAGMALAGLAWLVLALGLRWPPRTKAIAALPTVPAVAQAVMCAAAARDPSRGPDSYVSLWLLITVEVIAVAVLWFLWRRHLALVGPMRFRLALVLWGASAFGFLHVVGEYALMSGFSSANWDTPPGMGYLTVLSLLVSALVAAITAVHPPRAVTPTASARREVSPAAA